jgi:hypothetical protein
LNTLVAQSPTAAAAKIVRWSVSLQFTVLILQLAVILLFFSGVPEGLLAHSKIAWGVLGLGAVQWVAILAFAPARSDRFYSATAVAIVIAEALEITLGRTHALLAHVTLGMVIWGLGLTLLIRTVTAPWAAK